MPHKSTVTPDAGNMADLKKEIESWLGVVYKYGGADKQGVDCSAFVASLYLKVFKKAIPRTTREQYASCKKVSRHELKSGDLVFFNPGTSEVSHVGIFIEGVDFVHASVSKGVVISKLDNPYYQRNFVSGGRF
jgi:cell wall-associated NlpC family hydrolase